MFSRWSRSTPGCAVGASVAGRTVVRSAYGMADLERDVPNTPSTVFDAGSVAKQVTAAAMLLLVQEGKLSLDDAVRKYIPELPDYEVPVTIRQVLDHTSGLRDWLALESLAIAAGQRGLPERGRIDALAILGRQRALNFPPGTRWSYSNSGYALASIIVERVSGMSFVEFTSGRIFQPLGMHSTTWQQDLTRMVKHRALGYGDRDGTWVLDMPVAVVDGSGGLMTTIDDLLKGQTTSERPSWATPRSGAKCNGVRRSPTGERMTTPWGCSSTPIEECLKRITEAHGPDTERTSRGIRISRLGSWCCATRRRRIHGRMGRRWPIFCLVTWPELRRRPSQPPP